MKSLDQIPDSRTLLEWFSHRDQHPAFNVNNHIHTPYSFSAFHDIEQAVRLAKKDHIDVLGITDFFVTGGYDEFAESCSQHNIFPLFNIEFIGLNRVAQQNKVRVNDPNNPGRTYLTGKSLKFPAAFDPDDAKKVETVIEESQKQVASMIEKLNVHLKSIEPDIQLSIAEIYEKYAKNLVRERHIAKSLRIKASEYFPHRNAQLNFFTRLYGGSAPLAYPENETGFENEIRSRLLKAGGAAFVAEDESAFLSLQAIKRIILNAGGIPAYPVLLDDKNGNVTEFENNKKEFLTALKEMGIYSIEFIPGRNEVSVLEDYVGFFYDQGFVITFGTEHNTPALPPLQVMGRNNTPLTHALVETGRNGAAVMAAHQYLQSKQGEGYIDESGLARTGERSSFEKLGKAVIDYYLNEL